LTSEFTSDTPKKSEFPVESISIKISADGTICGGDGCFREALIGCGLFDHSSDGNLYSALIAQADAHNAFAAKLLEGMEAVITGEFDGFEMLCPDRFNPAEEMYQLYFHPDNSELGFILDIN